MAEVPGRSLNKNDIILVCQEYLRKVGDRMTFNEKIVSLFKELGLEGEIIETPPHLKATPEDYAKLEHEIALRLAENDRMLRMSELYARNSLPVQ